MLSETNLLYLFLKKNFDPDYPRDRVNWFTNKWRDFEAMFLKVFFWLWFLSTDFGYWLSAIEAPWCLLRSQPAG